VRAVQLYTGLGAGNVGDEFMARACWQQLPADWVLDIHLAPQSTDQRAAYPDHHVCHRLPSADLVAGPPTPDVAGALVVGTTPVAEREGPYALQGLAAVVGASAAQGLPVDAVGVGVEPLELPASRQLFVRSVGPHVRSWSVRSAIGREALLDLGVDPGRIHVGADWAWLYRRQVDLAAWAAAHWRAAGIDPDRPLLVANVVNLVWSACGPAKQAVAAALDGVAGTHDLQLAFLSHDYRPDPWMDAAAAAAVQRHLRRRATILPPLYYSPDEVLALLSRATVTVGQRYHFVVASVLAGSVPVAIPRTPKMTDLVTELQCPACGSIEAIDVEALTTALTDAVRRRAAWQAQLAATAGALARRAATNLDLVQRLPPYGRWWHVLARRAGRDGAGRIAS
jgi:polysaccharide pyruvyl transferase WcaK-like protein